MRHKVAKVTRVAKIRNATRRKYGELETICAFLATVRSLIWHVYGSINGVSAISNPKTGFSAIRAKLKQDIKAGRLTFGVPVNLWTATARNVVADMNKYYLSKKKKAKGEVYKRARRLKLSDEERKRLLDMIDRDQWMEDSFLRRAMRKHYVHGRNRISNQIVVDSKDYKIATYKGRRYIEVIGLTPRKRIRLPLNTHYDITGQIKIILRDGVVEIHHAIEEEISTKPPGTRTIGIDKGYTEAFTTSDGRRYGRRLGQICSEFSDKNKVSYQHRNRLGAIAKKNPHKKQNIEKNNLGRVKLNRRRARAQANVKKCAYTAVHRILDNDVGMLVSEDLSGVFKNKKIMSRDQKRRLSGWVKGHLRDAVEDVSRRRCASSALVNPSHTSQMDSRTGLLRGTRVFDRFYCEDKVVLDADKNAARNVLARLGDSEITLKTPPARVKEILLNRIPPTGAHPSAPGLQ